MNDKSLKRPRRERSVNFYFRCQPRFKTKHGTVLHYLNNEEESVLSRKERIMLALTAFWLPLAAKHRSGFSREELQQIARDSIYQLELHIRYLEETFGLERSSVAQPARARPQRRESLDMAWESDDENDGYQSEDDIVSKW